MVLLLVVSLSAGRIENLSPQGLKISAFRAFGRIRLSKVIAERGRSARFFNLYWRAARKHVAVIFLFAVIFSIFGIVTTQVGNNRLFVTAYGGHQRRKNDRSARKPVNIGQSRRLSSYAHTYVSRGGDGRFCKAASTVATATNPTL